MQMMTSWPIIIYLVLANPCTSQMTTTLLNCLALLLIKVSTALLPSAAYLIISLKSCFYFHMEFSTSPCFSSYLALLYLLLSQRPEEWYCSTQKLLYAPPNYRFIPKSSLTKIFAFHISSGPSRLQDHLNTIIP